MNVVNKHRTPFVMQGRYSQEFLDELAKAMGIKWTTCQPTLISNEIQVRPLPPPSNLIYYFEAKY